MIKKIIFWTSILIIEIFVVGILMSGRTFASYPADLTFIDNGDDTISEIGGTNLMWLKFSYTDDNKLF